MNNKLLLIGGVLDTKRLQTIGGTTVLMDNLIQYCEKHEIQYGIVPTNKYSGFLAAVRNYVSMICNTFRNLSDSQIIMVNISSLKGTYLLYSGLFLIAKLWRKKIVFRMFGGNLKSYLIRRPILQTIVVFFLKRSDLVLFETKELIQYFNQYNIKTAWFPNARKRNGTPKTEEEMKRYRKRFVFMAHVKKEKGIEVLIESFKKLSKDYTVDIYGLLVNYKKEDLQGDNYCYRGQLNPRDVFRTLKKYDGLILPTYWRGEGYPGIIVEAFSVGVPCIATDWGGIPELIEDGKNGFIVSPKNVDALVDAIYKFDRINHLELSQNAIETFDEKFNSETVNNRILNMIYSL